MKQIEKYTVIDLEMTGLAVKEDKIIEIGAVKVREGNVVDTYTTLINPKQPILPHVQELTGITNEMVAEGMDMDEAVEGLLEFIGEDPIVGHNVSFDYSFLKQWATNKKRPLELLAYDTLKLARQILPGAQSKKLEALCEYYGIERKNAHRALDDAKETQIIFEKLITTLVESGKELPKPQQMLIKIKRQTPATKHQIERLKEYRLAHGLTEEINWETLTRSQASRIMDHYYATYGR